MLTPGNSTTVQQEVQVREKREVETKPEGTIPGRVFVAVADIFETDQALTVVLEMPGVSKDEKAKPRKITVT